MQDLAAAEKRLLDGALRRQYDAERLEHQQQADTASQDTVIHQGRAATDWVQRAREFMDTGDLASASFPARESVQLHGSNDEAWSLRTHSAMGLGEWREAKFSFNEAIRLNPQCANYHFDLGCAYEAINDDTTALNKFQDALTLDPANPVYETATAGIYLNSRRGDLIQKSVDIMDRVVKAYSHEENFKYYLALGLIDLPFAYATLVGDGTSFFLTSAEQVSRLRADIDRAESLNVNDAHIRQLIRDRKKVIDDADTSTRLHPYGGARKAWIVLFVFLLFGLFGELIIGIPLLAAAIFGYIKLYRIPQWKAHATILSRTGEVARRGIGLRARDATSRGVTSAATTNRIHPTFREPSYLRSNHQYVPVDTTQAADWRSSE